MEEMKIQQKVFEMMEYAYVCLQQFPKSEKFALVVDIKRCMNLILERVVEGSKKYYKKTTLQELDVEVTKLNAYIFLTSLDSSRSKNTKSGLRKSLKLVKW